MMFNYKIIEHFRNNNLLYARAYSRNYVRHRQYGPAYLEWYEDGTPLREEWLVNDFRHRADGPAYLEWHEDGTLNYELWVIDGNLHREDGPAYLEWDENGTLYQEHWVIDGKWHRVDGPAYLHWNEDGTLKYRSYWVYGIAITEEIQEWANASGIKDIMNMTPEALVTFKLTWEV